LLLPDFGQHLWKVSDEDGKTSELQWTTDWG